MKEEKEREKENEASLTRASSEDISLSLDDEERSVDNEDFSVMELGELGNVRLKKSEYEAFIEEFPEDYSERIDELSLYMASSGREYKDHYATLKVFSKKRFFCIPPWGEGDRVSGGGCSNRIPLPRDSGSSSLLAKGEPYHSSLIAPHSSLITNNSELTVGNGGDYSSTAERSPGLACGLGHISALPVHRKGIHYRNDASLPHKGRRRYGSFDPNEAMQNALVWAMEDDEEEES